MLVLSIFLVGVVNYRRPNCFVNFLAVYAYGLKMMVWYQRQRDIPVRVGTQSLAGDRLRSSHLAGLFFAISSSKAIRVTFARRRASSCGRDTIQLLQDFRLKHVSERRSRISTHADASGLNIMESGETSNYWANRGRGTIYASADVQCFPPVETWMAHVVLPLSNPFLTHFPIKF